MYDAVTLSAELERAIANLSSTVRQIEVTQGFQEVLNIAQLDEVYCAALQLSSCVTEYLAKIIQYFHDNLGIVELSVILIFIVKNFLEGKEFVVSKRNIDAAAKEYRAQMGFLNVSMTYELLRHDKNEKREKILTWLWKEDYWKRHKNIRERRVSNTGKWFLQSNAFRDWRHGVGSHILVSYGIRTEPMTTLLIPW